jgi:hypothetical protein
MDTKRLFKKLGKAFLLSWYYSLSLGIVFLIFVFKAKNMDVSGSFSLWLTVIFPIDLFYGSGAAIVLTPFTGWALRLENKLFLIYGAILWIVSSAFIVISAASRSASFILLGALLLTVVGLGAIGFLIKGKRANAFLP